VLGVSEQDKNRIAEILHFKIGSLPIIHLGIPVSDCKLSKSQLSIVSQNTKKGGWAPGNGTTSVDGGKSIFISSCLSNIPLHIMGIYMLYEGNYQQLDSIRARFFWQGTHEKRK
jgi:hypothetical protein